MAEKKCPALIDGKECGLDLVPEETEEARMVGLYRCAFGHRIYIRPTKDKADPKESK